MAGKTYELGDQEELTFGVDWTDYLAQEVAGIASSSWTVPAELTNLSEGVSGTKTIIELKNLSGAIGDKFLITNEITLDDSYAQVAERSFTIKVVETKYK